MSISKTLTEMRRSNNPSEQSSSAQSSSSARKSIKIRSANESIDAKRSPRRAQTSKSVVYSNPNINVYSFYTNCSQETSDSAPQDSPNLERGYSKINLAVSHGLLMRYQPAIICATKPKNLIGPFDIYDVDNIRNKIRQNYKNEAYRKNTHELNRLFYKDLEFDDYFSKKSNWISDSKFTNTSSFQSAVKCYLPVINSRHLNSLSAKYVELKKNKRQFAEQRR
jgi:hypothetical protein